MIQVYQLSVSLNSLMDSILPFKSEVVHFLFVRCSDWKNVKFSDKEKGTGNPVPFLNDMRYGMRGNYWAVLIMRRLPKTAMPSIPVTRSTMVLGSGAWPLVT